MTNQDLLEKYHHPYATPSYYDHDFHGEKLEDDEKYTMLLRASLNIDVLTFGRIQGYIKKHGWDDGLTEMQKYLIQTACCQQAEFISENLDMIDAVFQQYSINGVSMTFGQSWNLICQNGVAMHRTIYELLKQTGLTTRTI